MTGELKTIASFQTPMEAEIARSRLESEGIPAFVLDSQMVGINWLLSSAVGGVRLQVLDTEAEAALEILGVDVSTTDPKTERGWGVCSSCGSAEVEPYRNLLGMAASIILLGFPVAFGVKGLRCRKCGKEMPLNQEPD